MPEVQHPPQVFSLSVDMLKPKPNCRRRPSQIRRLAERIEMLGFPIPVVVDEEGTVLLGQQRFLAAKRLGMVHVPAVFASQLTLVQRAAFLIAERELT